MDGLVYVIFCLFEKCGKFVAQKVYGPMPRLDLLSATELKKFKKGESEFQLDLSPNQLWVWVAAATPMAIGLVLFVIVFHDIWRVVFALALLCSLALTPIVSFINYRYERKRALRILGKLKRLPTCPVCEYDLTHTAGDACPECGELIAPLNDESES